MKYMNAARKYGRQAAVAAVGFASVAANAALPTVVTDQITTISGNVQAVFDAVIPVVALALGLVIIIKLFKRFGNKI
ncbi:phosphoenolpyruvate phosphomutase [Novimethylophilus kurashikiensis]|uniref:Phosphoenolpyruvate phosphomutase n=1 Tax=Novimethylophilus kurashikiensis TaxID=1825523 RepID=A0A2R5F413_9PROT|nr:major coat protein [Novimethylophilus kurashikiensis]GBG13177.1 phosphoenolpyruvate phosphomutase [Novimethylophilus kurashikiensis]